MQPTIYTTLARRFGNYENNTGVTDPQTVIHNNSGFAEFGTQGDTITLYQPIYADVQGYSYPLDEEIPSNAIISGIQCRYRITLPSVPWTTWKFGATPMLGSTLGNSFNGVNGDNSIGGSNNLMGLSPTPANVNSLKIRFTLSQAVGIANGDLRLTGNTIDSGNLSPLIQVYYYFNETKVNVSGHTKVSITGNTRAVVQNNDF
jgi:hypothetical protein